MRPSCVGKGGCRLFVVDGRCVFDVGPELACDMMNRDPNIKAQKKGGKRRTGKEQGRRGKKRERWRARPFTCGTWSIKCLLRTNGNCDPEAPVDVDTDCEVAIDEEVDEECEED